MEISLFVDLDDVAVRARMNLPEWVAWFRTNHDLDLTDGATWFQVYHAIAVDHVAGGDHADLIRSQGWTIDDVPEGSDPTIGVDVATPAERAAAMMTGDDVDDDDRWDIPPNAGSAG